MTPDERVYQTLRESDLLGTKLAWPVGGAPPLPWFTYRKDSGGEVYADNQTYSCLIRYQADLYQADADDDIRLAFETQVAKLGPYSSSEVWVAAENCWMTSYSFTFHPEQ